MKLASFRDGDRIRIGAVHHDDMKIFDLAAAADRDGRAEPAFAAMLNLIEAGPAALDRARDLLARLGGDAALNRAVADTALLSPVPVPPQVRDFSVFSGHIKQSPAGMQKLAARARGDEAAIPGIKPLADVPPVYAQQPIYYITNRFSVVGTNTEVTWPRYSKVMDFELEFGIFIGRGGKNIPADKARDHIFGFAIMNDFSARDAQMVEMQGMLGPAKGKSFDAGNVIGPWIVTADEIPDPYSLKMKATISGEVWAEGTSAGMLHSFEDMIAFVTRDETIYPGEFFGSGTMGNGCGLEQDRFLRHGDVVELTVEKIGTLRNTVVRQDVG